MCIRDSVGCGRSRAQGLELVEEAVGDFLLAGDALVGEEQRDQTPVPAAGQVPAGAVDAGPLTGGPVAFVVAQVQQVLADAGQQEFRQIAGVADGRAQGLDRVGRQFRLVLVQLPQGYGRLAPRIQDEFAGAQVQGGRLELVDLIDHDGVRAAQHELRHRHIRDRSPVQPDAQRKATGHEVVVIGHHHRGGARLPVLGVLAAGGRPRARGPVGRWRQRQQPAAWLLAGRVRMAGLGVMAERAAVGQLVQLPQGLVRLLQQTALDAGGDLHRPLVQPRGRHQRRAGLCTAQLLKILADVPGRGQRGLDRGQHEGDGQAVDRIPGGGHAHQDTLAGPGGRVEDVHRPRPQPDQLLRRHRIRGLQLCKQVLQDRVHVPVCGRVAPVDQTGQLEQLPGRQGNLFLVGHRAHLGQLRPGRRRRLLFAAVGEDGDDGAPLDEPGAGRVLRARQPDARPGRPVRAAAGVIAAQPLKNPVDILQQIPAHQRNGRLGPPRGGIRGPEGQRGRLAVREVQQLPRAGGENGDRGQFLRRERHHRADALLLVVRQVPPPRPLVELAAEQERRVPERSDGRAACLLLAREVVGCQGQRGPDRPGRLGQAPGLGHCHAAPAFLQISSPMPLAVAVFSPNSPATVPTRSRLDSR